MSRGSSGDGYRRGRNVEQDGDDWAVSGRYRPILPVIWGIGAVLFLVVGWFDVRAALAVVLVTHLFFAGLIRADIKSLRRQGVDWGHSRHLWFGAAFTLPFVALAYYWYSGRVVRRENDARGVGDGEDAGGERDTEAGDAAERPT